ncbi:MAG: ATP-binding cassette domain-containing protein [Acidobacteria bacterium]|nr:ATP-binding cassette domain-containing protein [Acidobacteriota bacterium]
MKAATAPIIASPAAAPRQAVFQARQISKVYRMGEVEVHALRTVDMDLFEGEFVVLLGPSGSGKSTLLNILGGLDVPTSGEVVFRDHHLSSADERELTRFRREHIGFVFQFYNLIPSLTALENVELVTEIAESSLPAEAMRPEPPARFRAGFIERLGLARFLSPASRIIVRNLARRPIKAALTSLGIAFAVSLLVTGLYLYDDAINRVLDVVFGNVYREDVAVTFNEPMPARARYDIAHLPADSA